MRLKRHCWPDRLEDVKFIGGQRIGTKTRKRLIMMSDTKRLILAALLAVSTGLFLAGLFLPIMTLSKFVIFENSFSIASGVYELAINGRFFLFVIILGLSIVLPLIKLGILFYVLLYAHVPSEKLSRLLKVMHDYGRWAMLDVMVVAILIVTVKLGAIASIAIHSGLYVFGSAVLMIMLVTHLTVNGVEHAQN